MLTFSEALTQLKAGEDMRIKTWPRQMFVRAVAQPAGVPALLVHNRNPGVPPTAPYPYTYPNAEVFGQDWTRA